MRFLFLILSLLITISSQGQGLAKFLRQQSVSSAEGATGVYGVTKINKNYNGPSVHIYDNTTTLSLGDFGWILIPPYANEYKIDETSIDAALSGHEGKVSIWYDQGSNGYKWTQSTLANMPYYRNSAYTGDTTPSIHFNNASGALDHFFNSSIPTDSFDLSIMVVGQGNVSFFPGISTGGADFLFYSGGNPSLLNLSDNLLSRTSTTCVPWTSGTTSPVIVMNTTQMGYTNKNGTGAKMFYSSFYSGTFASLPTQKINSTALLGKRSNGQFKQLGFFKELIVYTSAMSSTVEAKLKSDQNRIYGIAPITDLVLEILHSKKDGYTSTLTFNSPTVNSPPYKLMKALKPNFFVVKLSVPSQTIQGFVASNTYLTGKRFIGDYPSLNSIVGFMDSGNNFAESFSTIQTRTDNLINDFKASNANVYWILTTVNSRVTYDSGQETMRTTQVNPDIISRASFTNKIISVDISGITSLNVGGTGMDVDGTHWNTSGNTTYVNTIYPYYYLAHK